MAKKHNPYKPLWGLFALILGISALTAVSRFRGGNDRIPWRTTFAAGMDEARRDGKPALLYFTATYCEPCQRMKRSTWADADVDAKLRDYVPVKIDVEQDSETAIKYEAYAVPTFVLIDKDGKTTKWADGYLSAKEFLAWEKQ